MGKAVFRRVGSALCWTLAVVSGVITGAGFVTGAVVCDAGQAARCPPQGFQLLVGVVATAMFVVLGAKLYRPRYKEPPRNLWDHRS